MNTKNPLQEMEINSLETVTGGHIYFGRIAVMAAEALLASAAVVDAGGAFGNGFSSQWDARKASLK